MQDFSLLIKSYDFRSSPAQLPEETMDNDYLLFELNEVRHVSLKNNF